MKTIFTLFLCCGLIVSLFSGCRFDPDNYTPTGDALVMEDGTTANLDLGNTMAPGSHIQCQHRLITKHGMANDLSVTDMTVQQISDYLNFPSQTFFGKYFKRRTGLSPKEYRRVG